MGPPTMPDQPAPSAVPAAAIDIEKIIKAAQLCSLAVVRGDDLEAFAYAEAVIRICRTEMPS